MYHTHTHCLDQPVMSLFSKKKASKRQFRKKVIHSLEDDESAPPDHPTTCEETSVRVATATPSTVPKSLLSFDNEDLGDGTEFKVKKSNHAKRTARKLEEQKRKEELQRVMEKVEPNDSSDSEQESALSSISHRISVGVIPDNALIHAARKQRELARKTGGQPAAAGNDFMSLDSNEKETGRAKGKSRLVREDEYDKSDESDGEERGKFGKRAEVSRQMQVLTAMEEAGSGSDEDRFVEEQINKAVKGCVVSDVTRPRQSYSLGQTETESYVTTSQPPVASIPDILVPITVETLKSRLSQQLSELRSLHRKHEIRLEEMESDIVTADQEVGGLEDHISRGSIEYQFYQETRGYMKDLLSCLTEKVMECLLSKIYSCLQ